MREESKCLLIVLDYIIEHNMISEEIHRATVPRWANRKRQPWQTIPRRLSRHGKKRAIEKALDSPDAVLEAEKKRRRKREDGRTIRVMTQ